jgi:hypothetical protein
MKNDPAVLKHWQERIQQWRASGKGILEWCRENKIPYPQFWAWRKKIESPKETARQSKTISFSELSDSESSFAGIDIIIADKTLRLHKNFDESTLRLCLLLLGG